MMSQAQQQALGAPRSIGVRSPAFPSGKAIPREFTGTSDDISPALEWTGVPDATQSIAIVVDDPDAPGGTYTHWLVWDLPPTARSLPEGVDPATLGAKQGGNDFGYSKYMGPLPPSGTHRYYFRVLALDKWLALAPNSKADDVWRALAGHVLAWGELMGTFTKP